MLSVLATPHGNTLNAAPQRCELTPLTRCRGCVELQLRSGVSNGVVDALC